ncbi:PAS domain-containing protein [Streptomyces sioyaensis]|uniref:PAS domain S-box protein n=1 Tax=Streptomyces sioyaensis TaxID=67364 RepID=A0A4V1NQQ8_9ACTN|nr:helix-turn-helix transcriptional regulator [Streptomyces sioyaensis]MBM4791651.1 PAS domain-containing protein [Streptomyces sioyaensis]RXS69169.1 PAS domain S-box protein [Streptomyces sioyaensis]
MDETSLKSLLENLPVSWWEADRELRVIDSGGGAFDDTSTAQRFLDTVRKELPEPAAPPGTSHWQAQFDGRLFDVNWPLGVPRQGRSRGLAVEVGPRPADPRRYDAFADLAPAAAFIRDANGRYLWTNHAYAHVYGTTPEHIIGRSVTDVDGPDDAAQVLALDREVLARGKPVRHTLTYHRFDGGSGQAAGHRFPVLEAGQTCVAGIYIDISDYTRALHQRREAEENLHALRDHSGLPCALISAGGRIRQASAAAAELLQTRLSDLVGRRAHTVLAPAPELTGLRRSWHDLIARRSRRIQTSALFVDARGRQRRARLHLTSVGWSADRARSVWAVVTHQGIAHEARAPLTATQIRLLSLLAAGHSNAEIATSLHLSRQTVDYHLSRLRDLLDAPTRPALVARAYVLGILAPQTWPPRSATACHPHSVT